VSERKLRSRSKPTAKKRAKSPSDESLIKRWRRHDRTIKKEGDSYFVSEDSKALRWSLENGEAVYLWKDRDEGDAKIIHVKKDDSAKVDGSDVIEEARFGIDFAISHIEDEGDTLGQFYSERDRIVWIQRLKFYRDSVIPLMTVDQLDWFSAYFIPGLDYLIQLSEAKQESDAGDIVASGMRKLYRTIYEPSGERIDGVTSFPVKIKSAQ
jgi:hypothetical protein